MSDDDEDEKFYQDQLDAFPDEDLLEAFPVTAEERKIYLEQLRRNVVDIANAALESDQVNDERKALIRWRLGDVELAADRVINGSTSAWWDLVAAEQIIFAVLLPDTEISRRIIRKNQAAITAKARQVLADKNAAARAALLAAIEKLNGSQPVAHPTTKAKAMLAAVNRELAKANVNPVKFHVIRRVLDKLPRT
jgi:hypothetical protein